MIKFWEKNTRDLSQYNFDMITENVPINQEKNISVTLFR